MAYKFQLGDFSASGSITAQTGFDANNADIDNVDSGSFGEVSASGMILAAEVNFDDVSNIAGTALSNNNGVLDVGVDDSSIEISSDSLQVKALGVTNAMLAGSIANAKLANSTISGIALGSNLNSLSAGNGISMTSFNGSAAVSDLTIDLSGSANGLNVSSDGLAVKLSGSGGLGADANGVFIALQSGSGLEIDATGMTIEAGGVENAMLENQSVTVTAGDGLGGGGAVNLGAAVSLSVNVDDSSIETNADSLRVKAGGITNAMLAGSIANAKLANQSVTVGTTAINLGASSTTLAGMTGIDFAAGNASIAANIGANTLTLGGSTSTIQIAGDLDVVGTLNRVTETELLIEDKVVIVASGSTNAAGAAGSGLKVDIATGDMSFLYQANGENVGGVDASASGDIFVASGSSGLIDIQAANFYGSGANLSGVTADGVAYSVASKADGNTLEADKYNYFADLSADATVTLPASAASLIGKSIFVKAAGLTNDAVIIINRVGSQTIDGETSIRLESGYAAVRLVYVATDDWRVF